MRRYYLQICSFKQSLALKALGFDVWCFFCYNRNQELSDEPDLFQNCTTDTDLEKNSCMLIAAPYIQTALNWFREKGIIGEISYSPISGKYGAYVSTKDWKYPITEIPLKSSYSEIERMMLDKLIEIYKNGGKYERQF